MADQSVFDGAPEWARFRVTIPDGRRFWLQMRPVLHDDHWGMMPSWLCEPAGVGDPSTWRESLIERETNSSEGKS